MPISSHMKLTVQITAVSVLALGSALVSVINFNAVVSSVALMIQAGITFWLVYGLMSLRNQRVEYIQYRSVADGKMFGLLVITLSSIFTITSLFIALDVHDWFTRILSVSTPLAFLLFALLHDGHKAEPTIYDAFIKKPS